MASSSWVPLGESVRVLDTVVLDEEGSVVKWIYTSSKSGVVCERVEPRELSWEKIGKRFLKFAAGSRYVASLVLRDGTRLDVDETNFLRMATSAPQDRQISLAGVSAVQASFQSKKDARYWCDLVTLHAGGDRGLGLAAERRLKEATEAVKKKLLANEADDDGGGMDSLRCHFARDNQGHFWLTGVSKKEEKNTELFTKSLPDFPERKRTTEALKRKKKRPELPALKVTQRQRVIVEEAVVVPEEDGVEDEEKKKADDENMVLQVVRLRKKVADLENGLKAASQKFNDREEERNIEHSALERLVAEERCRADRAEEEATTERLSKASSKKTTITENTNVTLLLEQLDAREGALMEAEARWALERRELEAKIARASAAVTQDLSTKCDDLITQCEAEQNKAASLEARLTTVLSKLATAEAAAAEAQGETDVLRRHLSDRDDALDAARRSAQVSLNLDRAANRVDDDHLSSEEASSSSKNLATAAQQSAKTRQLHNKIVFLQASLAMETEAKHDVEGKLEEILRGMQAERDQARQRLTEVEADKNNALAAAEARSLAAIDEVHARANHFESKLAQAQAAYADALHDASTARRREEAAKTEAQREKTKRQATEAHCERERQARLEAQQQQETMKGDDVLKKSDQDDSNKKLVVEAAIVRRLENEKEYLQAQLTSEATCKSELQAALAKAMEDLEAARESAEAAARNGLEASRLAALKLDQTERDLRAKTREHASDAKASKEQLDTLRAAYAKARDGLRVEQVDHNKTRVARGDLLSQASRLRADRERAEAALIQARDRASDDLQAAKAAFEDSLRLANVCAETTREELAETLALLNGVKGRERELRDLVALKDRRMAQAAKLSLILGTASGLAREGRPLRLKRCFGTWARATLRAEAVEARNDAVCAAMAATNAQVEHRTAQHLGECRDLWRDATSAAQAAAKARATLEATSALGDQKDRSDDRLAAAMAASATMAAIRELELDESVQRLKDADGEARGLFGEVLRLKDELRAAKEATHAREHQEQRRALKRCDETLLDVAKRSDAAAEVVESLRRDLEEILEKDDDQAALIEDLRAVVATATSALSEARERVVFAKEAFHDNNMESFRMAMDAAAASSAVAVAVSLAAEGSVLCKAKDLRREAWRARCSSLEVAQAKIEANYDEKIELLQKEVAFVEARRRVAADAQEAAAAAGTALREVRVVGFLRKVESSRCVAEELREASRQAASAAKDAMSASEAVLAAVTAERERKTKEFLRERSDLKEATSAVLAASVAMAERREEDRWRSSLREAEARSDERQAAAWRAGMEERDRVAKAEAASLRAAAEQALSEVKASAASSLQSLRSDTKQALEKAARAAAQRQEKSVSEAERAVCSRERALKSDAVSATATALLAIKASALSELQNKEDARKARMKQQFDRESQAKDSEVSTLREAVAKYRESSGREAERAQILANEKTIAVERAEKRLSQRARAREKEASLESDRVEAARVAETARAHATVLEAAFEAADRKAEIDLANAVESERRRHDDIVRDLKTCAESKDGLIRSLKMSEEKLRDLLEVEKEKVTEAKGRIEWMRKASSFARLKLATLCLRQLAKEKNEGASVLAKAKGEYRALAALRQKEEGSFYEKQSLSERRVAHFEALVDNLRETLVNHERATLVSHRSNSEALQSDLDIIIKKRDDKQRERDQIHTYLKDMENSVRSLEASIRDHAQASSIGLDGRVNVAHAKRKRRMDDDHDALLSGIERQRTTLLDLDSHLADLNNEIHTKEAAIAAQERRLVEVLILQQRKLIAILSSAAEKEKQPPEKQLR